MAKGRLSLNRMTTGSSTSGEAADLRELLHRAIEGNSSAFEQLVSPHLAPVRRITFAFSRDRASADELAQEALLKAFRFLHTFRGDHFGPWLYSVARSVCHDWYRQQKSRGRGHEVEFDEEQDATQNESPETLLGSRHEGERLWAAIRRLNPKFRVPLVLFEIEGLSYEQVARVEAVPVGTIRSRLARARKQLLAQLSVPSLRPEAGTLSHRTASSIQEPTND